MLFRSFNQLIEEGAQPYAAEAALSRTQLLLKTKGETLEQAIKHLDELRFEWRGDDFEYRLLAQPGEYYLQAGDYRNGLSTLRQTLALFPDASKVGGVANRLNEVFADLYLRGGAEKLPPVQALALYYDFRELTPVGNDGDEMVRRLADRLVSVDLLQQAAELLDYQVQFRLRGEEKAAVASRLAAI